MGRTIKWLTILIILIALLCCASALAETGGTDGDIQWTLSDDGVLTISGNGYMRDYTVSFDPYSSTTSPWGSWQSNKINSVIINQGVKNISSYAFHECENLMSVTIPDSVRTIDEYAFQSCFNLKELIIPGSVTKIGWGAFEYCHNLESIILQEGIRRIEPNAFSGCSELSEITIPESVCYVGERVFSGCTGLADENDCIVIGDTLYGCRPTNGRLNIPDGVKKIDSSAFSSYYMECKDITNIIIPGSVEIIGENAFMGFSFENLSSVTIEDGVKRIEAGAFSFCTHLENITIPDSVTYIGESAFRGCLQMADDDGFIIYDDVLYGYEGSSLNVIIPYGVKRIESSAFEFNLDLLSVVIPNSVTRIECQAFNNCTKLTSITIPDSVTYIGYNNFRSPYLADDDGFVIIRNNLQCYLGNAAIVNIPYGVTNIDDFAFNGNTDLVRVTIPSTVTRIGNYTFAYCTNLSRINISNSVRIIGHHAFYDTGLSNITIPESVTNIEDYAFRNCQQLTNATVLNPDTVFGMNVFHQCPSSLNLRGDIDSTIRRYANENDQLFVAMVEMDKPDFTLPAELTTIEDSAFSGIDASMIYIPDTVTSIGNLAFSYCNKLYQIRIPAFIKTIPDDIFKGIPTYQIIIFGTIGSAAQRFAHTAGILFAEK